MAVLDVARKTLTIKLVYYGCAMSGKTTNLQTLHRLTDPGGTQGLISIATKDDRTLFFDLLPMDLGQVGGLTVRVKAYTVPGQVHYELTRKQVLSGTDGVVLVFDSGPDLRQANAWAADNLRLNLRANGLDPDDVPTVFQWNKRDLPSPVSVDEMQANLNPRHLPAFEAVATTGAGVIETFSAALKLSLHRAYAKTGKNEGLGKAIDAKVDEAFREFVARAPSVPQKSEAAAGYEHRVDTQAYKGKWADRGIDRKILDHETLLSEAVQTGMQLAERLDALNGVQAQNERAGRMIERLAELVRGLADPAAAPLPPGTLKMLMSAAGRAHGSILFFKPNEKVMDEREVVPAPPDPMNAVVAASLGSAAYRLAQAAKPRLIEDLASEVFFDTVPPSASGLGGALVVPVACDGLSFGALTIYSAAGEEGFETIEKEFWSGAATQIGLALHWRALKRKLSKPDSAARPTPSGQR